MTWRRGRQLTTLQTEENSIQYKYDSDSIRTSKIVDGVVHTYEYLDGLLMHETRGEQAYDYYYDANGQLYAVSYKLSENDTKKVYYFTHNWRGDIVGIYNGNGDLKATYSYDAWGNVTAIKDADGNAITSATHIANLNPFRYRGYYMDTETGFYLTGTRYYDPEIGRFINADAYIQTPNGDMISTNMFAYCGNNPVHRYDPTGEFFLTATIGGIAAWKIIGTLVVGLVATYVVADTIAKNPPKLPTISLPKIEIQSKSKEKTKTKDIAPTLPKRPAKDPVHHIVAKADRRAEESRQILRDVGIEPVTDPQNLVVLPQNYHVSLHTTAYHNYVTERLRLVAGDRQGVEATLNSLRTEILARSAQGIRWD